MLKKIYIQPIAFSEYTRTLPTDLLKQPPFSFHEKHNPPVMPISTTINENTISLSRKQTNVVTPIPQ